MKRSGRWPSTVRGEPTRSAPRSAARRAIVVARRSGERAAGPKRESWARRGWSGCAVKVKPATGAPGGRASSSRRTSVRSVLTSRVGAGSAIARASQPSGSSFRVTSRRAQARACDSRRCDEPLERRVARRRGRARATTSGHSRSMPSEKDGRRQAGLERARIDAARGGVELAAELAQAARDFAFRQVREVADRADAPALERLGDLDLGSEARERERREEARLFAFGDDGGRVGEARGDARGELGGGDADARGQAAAFSAARSDVAVPSSCQLLSPLGDGWTSEPALRDAPSRSR